MNKLILLIIVILSSCTKEEKHCYIFTLTNTITMSPAQDGYPKSTESEIRKCAYTENEAKMENARLTTTSISKTDSSTITVAQTSRATIHKSDKGIIYL